MVGTFGYCAPEQMLGGVTPVSDLYSAGATLLFLLSGRAPSTMPQSRLKINFRGVVTIESARLEAVVARLLEPAAEDRFQTAGAALKALTVPPGAADSSSPSRGGSMGGRNFRGGGGDTEGMDFDLDLAGINMDDGGGSGSIRPGVFPRERVTGDLGEGGGLTTLGDRSRPRKRIRTPAAGSSSTTFLRMSSIQYT